MDLLPQTLLTLVSYFTSLNSRLAILYICSTILVVAVLWIVRGRPKTFGQYLLPKEVYFHKSNIVDIKIFLFNSVLSASGLFAAVTLTPVMTVAALNALLALTGASPAPVDLTMGKMALATLIIILTLDFCTYWAHRLHHEMSFLWPFHALHHSAEVMTPLTVSRKHPIYMILSALLRTSAVGSIQALVLFLLMGKIEILAIGSANAGYFIFNALGSNLRHSHIWLSYGPVLEHVFVSPAQHQVHHSIDPKHHNKNYGEVFAIWDLMFGTLYVLRSHEKLVYGLGDEHGQRIEQPYPNLRMALLHPFADSWRALWKGTSRDPETKLASKTNTPP